MGREPNGQDRGKEFAGRRAGGQADEGARTGGPPSPAPPGPMVVARAEELGTPRQGPGGRGRLDETRAKGASGKSHGRLAADARNGFRAAGRGEADKVLAMAEVMARDIPGSARRSPAETARELSSLARRIEEGRRASRARTTAVAKTPAAPRRAESKPSREVVIEYVDLVPCLARASVALRDAGVPYAIQPEGSGCFVVTTSVTQKQIRRLLPLLERAARPVRGWVKEESAVRRELADASIEAKQRTAQRLHFVVRFRRASPPAAPRPE